jgi:hypothetical protein
MPHPRFRIPVQLLATAAFLSALVFGQGSACNTGKFDSTIDWSGAQIQYQMQGTGPGLYCPPINPLPSGTPLKLTSLILTGPGPIGTTDATSLAETTSFTIGANGEIGPTGVSFPGPEAFLDQVAKFSPPDDVVMGPGFSITQSDLPGIEGETFAQATFSFQLPASIDPSQGTHTFVVPLTMSQNSANDGALLSDQGTLTFATPSGTSVLAAIDPSPCTDQAPLAPEPANVTPVWMSVGQGRCLTVNGSNQLAVGNCGPGAEFQFSLEPSGGTSGGATRLRWLGNGATSCFSTAVSQFAACRDEDYQRFTPDPNLDGSVSYRAVSGGQCLDDSKQLAACAATPSQYFTSVTAQPQPFTSASVTIQLSGVVDINYDLCLDPNIPANAGDIWESATFDTSTTSSPVPGGTTTTTVTNVIPAPATLSMADGTSLTLDEFDGLSFTLGSGGQLRGSVQLQNPASIVDLYRVNGLSGQFVITNDTTFGHANLAFQSASVTAQGNAQSAKLVIQLNEASLKLSGYGPHCSKKGCPGGYAMWTCTDCNGANPYQSCSACPSCPVDPFGY